MRIKVDTTGLTRTAELSAKQLQRATLRGLNNAAFEARSRIPDIVAAQVDRMSPKLKVRSAIRIHKATASDPTATVTIGGGQGAVLARHEFGFTAKTAAIPLSRAGNRAADRYGNLNKRVRHDVRDAATTNDSRSKKRRKSKTKKPVGRYFTVAPGGSLGTRVRRLLGRDLKPGIYERVRGNNKITRIVAFERRKKYRSNFSIREGVSEEIGPEAVRFIQESIDFRLNR